jgi:DNA-binding response OmpR family regulator
MARILIAEDEANIFKLVSFRLKHLGHEVIWAQNGGQALEAAREQSPDLILLDVMMPVYDGFQVLKKLKADADTQPIPVIMLTARGHEKDVVTGIEGGADDYIVKPFSFPELIARVNAVLARRPRAPDQ